jgi:hypothetical protein
MKQVFFILFFFYSSLNLVGQDLSCIRKTIGKYYGINDNKVLEEWRNDSTGCKGNRLICLNLIIENKLLIGMPKTLFYVLFGIPNKCDKDETECTYYVTITCDKKRKQIDNTDFMNLLVAFKNGKVEQFVMQIT